METLTPTEELLEFFKALADTNRLKIVGLLAREPMTVEQMAEILGLHSSTISHHLLYLAHVGLVSARPEGYYSVYQLDVQALQGMAHRLLAQGTLPAVAEDLDIDAYDRKVLISFLTQEGKIRDFPAQDKKIDVLLRHVVQAFEPGRRYTEKEVNGVLSQFNEDTARLRRYLVEFKYMKRTGGGGEYWRESI